MKQIEEYSITCERYYTGMGYFFWGLLLPLVDFNFFFFDILPDFLGFYLIYKGAGIFLHKNPLFRSVRAISFFMIFPSVFEAVIYALKEFSRNPADEWFSAPYQQEASYSAIDYLLQGYYILESIAVMVLICIVLTGLFKTALWEGQKKIAAQTRRYRNLMLFFLPINSFCTIIFPLLNLEQYFFFKLYMLYLFIYFIIYLLIILNISNLKYNLLCCQIPEPVDPPNDFADEEYF